MGCMQSSNDQQLSQMQQSSYMFYKLMKDRYNVQVQPPSIQNSSMIHRLEQHTNCPSQVFIDWEMDKCFLSLTDTSSENNEKTHEDSRTQSRSVIISLKSTKYPKLKLGRRMSETILTH